MGVVVCLSIEHRELLGEYRGVEAGDRKMRESDDESRGTHYPKANCWSKWRCKATDSSVMGLATPCYRRGGASVESSIPCSHRGRVFVMKRAKEVENVEANSKYQDKAEGQRPENIIRQMSTGFSLR
ncbi:hypothetical protein BHE74_00026720 [Ensete ventricosum]|nr:hypothetical protein GW17_00036189 [Ensete ventricosum]RWW65951.1 hypothetical protein BHE74_00026720 [Ensete ventricosum]